MKAYKITTPSCMKCIRQIARKSYGFMTSTVGKSPRMFKPIIWNVANKIKSEMKDMSSDGKDSLLRDSVETVKQFNWEAVMLELLHMAPTLMSLLSQLVKRPAEKKPLLCLLSSQLLKSRHHHMGLVQRAVSVMMYGNSTAKQVH